MSGFQFLFILFLTYLSAVVACQAQQDTLVIVAFGNSTTAPRSTIDSVYADRLPDILASSGIHAKVINNGVGGSHTGRLVDNDHHIRKHALDRFEEAVLVHDPDIVIIQFGINDSYVDSDRPNGSSRIPINDFRRNLRHMIIELKSREIQVLLMSPNAFGSNKVSWRHDRLSEYAGVTKDLASEEQIAFIDIYSYFEVYGDGTPAGRDKLLLDGVHPNSQGHRAMAEMIAKKIDSINKK